MKIHACQLAAETSTVAQRLAAIEVLVAEAAADGADLVVFPELAVTGYGAGETIVETAEGADGALVQRFDALTKDHSIAIVIGIAVRDGQGRTINAALATRPGMSPIVYAKQHLFADYERALFSPGRSASPVFEIAGMRAGLLICYDVEFPERVRELAIAGAEIVIVPTALPASAAAAFVAEHLVPVRAFENQIFVVYVNHAGRDARFAFQGQSTIAAPDGARIAHARADGADVLIAVVDSGDYAASRAENAYLADLAPREDVSVRPERMEADANPA